MRLEPPDRSMERWPQVGSPAEEAHFEQVVDGLDENLVVRVRGVGRHVDGTDEQAVRGVDIAISVEQVIGARDRPGQCPCVIGINLPDVVEQSRRVAQVAQHGRPDVGGLGPATALIGRRGTQLRGPRHLRYGAHRVATVQMGASDAFEQ